MACWKITQLMVFPFQSPLSSGIESNQPRYNIRVGYPRKYPQTLTHYHGNINIHIDPEGHQFLVETHLPSPKKVAGSMLIYWRLYQISFDRYHHNSELNHYIYHQFYISSQQCCDEI